MGKDATFAGPSLGDRWRKPLSEVGLGAFAAPTCKPFHNYL
jgi:hypothetical protein